MNNLPTPQKIQKPRKNAFKRMKGWLGFQTKAVKPANDNKSSLTNPGLFIDALKKRGFKKLGSGMYATVLGHPSSDRVIKVNRCKDNWIGYAHWAAKEGFAGAHAPKVYSFKDHGNWSVSVVEKLDKTIRDVEDNEDAQAINSMFDLALRGNQLAMKICNDNQHGLGDFIQKIAPMEPGDLHDGNFMVRKDGKLVLTDPTGDFPRVNQKRLYARDFQLAA